MAVLRIPTGRVTLDFGDTKEKPIVIQSAVNLISVNVQIGEKDRSNSLQVVFADPELEIATRLRLKSLKTGGIAIPKTLLAKDETVTGAAGIVPTSSKALPKNGNPGPDPEAYIGGTVEVSLSAEYRAYLDLIAWCEGATYNTTLGYKTVITNFSQHPARLQGLSDAAGRYQFLSTTWRGLNLPDFTPKNQDLGAKKLIESRGAAGAVSRGLSGLNEFLDKCSYEWASMPSSQGQYRYSGQGTKTPAQCRDFLGKALNYYKSGGVTGAKTATPVGPAAPTKAASNEDAIPKDAIEVSVDMAWSDGTESITFQFWYISHSTSTEQPPRTTIAGRGIRFLMNSGPRDRRVYKNISFRQIAQRLGAQYGVNVEIPDKPVSEKIVQHLKQSGQTDFQFLMSVAEASGFIVQEDPGKDGKRTVKFVEASSKSAVRIKVSQNWGATFETSDAASEERILKALPSITTIADDKEIGEGYETRLTIAYPSMATMKIKPGYLIEIPKGSISGLPSQSAFCREYRVKSNSISDEGGTRKQTLVLYIPINQKPKAKNSAGDSNNPVGEVGPDGLVKPTVTSANWNDNGDRVSKFWTVGDVISNDPERRPVPKSAEEKNIFLLAAQLDKVVEEWCRRKKVSPARGVLVCNSWYRPPAVNARVGGSSGSLHILGLAADIRCASGDADTNELQSWLMNNWAGALGTAAPAFVHLDIRGNKAFRAGASPSVIWKYI